MMTHTMSIVTAPPDLPSTKKAGIVMAAISTAAAMTTAPTSERARLVMEAGYAVPVRPRLGRASGLQLGRAGMARTG